MSLLETQVGQIQVGGKKLSKSFVSLQSEKLPATEAEIYAVVEITPLKKSEFAEAEKVSNIISSELKKHFSRTSPNSFENAVAQINHELSRLAANGKTSWVGKLDAVIAAKQQEHLFIATTGKVQAYLYRDGQFSNISDSALKQNPLKVFENFAIGKVKRKDTLILSSAQLFNYITMQRLHAELVDKPILSACESIAEILTEASDESISLGTFIIDFAAATNIVPSEPVAERVAPTTPTRPSPIALKEKTLLYAAALTSRINKVNWKSLTRGSVERLSIANFKTLQRSKFADLSKLKSLPRNKKFFLVSAAIFLVLLVTNVAIAVNSAGQDKIRSRVSAQLELIQNKINDANSAYIYSDQREALRLLNEAEAELNALSDPEVLKDERSRIAAELQRLKEKAR